MMKGSKAKRPETVTEWNARWPTFKARLIQQGVQVLEPVRSCELLRAIDRNVTCLVIKDKNGALVWNEMSDRLWKAFVRGGPRTPALPKLGKANERATRATLRIRDGLTCFYCDEVFPEGALTVEHLCAQTHAGPDHIANKALACGPCNKEADHLSVVEKVRLRDDKRVRRQQKKAVQRPSPLRPVEMYC